MERYFATYPGVKRYLDETRAFAREHGYVETLLGRRRYFPVLNTTATGSQAYAIRQAAERAAINHPIQGTAADIIKIAMVRPAPGAAGGWLPGAHDAPGARRAGARSARPRS